jgi:hypothetical protein
VRRSRRIARPGRPWTNSPSRAQWIIEYVLIITTITTTIIIIIIIIIIITVITIIIT